MIRLALNKIGDKGAIALAECLTATLVTCFSGARDTLWARIHKRHSATCRATALACCSVRLIGVVLCGLRDVSRRKVRSDFTRARRACMRRVEPCGRTPPTFGQLHKTRMQNYLLRVRRKSSTLSEQDMASGTEPLEQGLTSSIGRTVSTSTDPLS